MLYARIALALLTVLLLAGAALSQPAGGAWILCQTLTVRAAEGPNINTRHLEGWNDHQVRVVAKDPGRPALASLVMKFNWSTPPKAFQPGQELTMTYSGEIGQNWYAEGPFGIGAGIGAHIMGLDKNRKGSGGQDFRDRRGQIVNLSLNQARPVSGPQTATAFLKYGRGNPGQEVALVVNIGPGRRAEIFQYWYIYRWTPDASAPPPPPAALPTTTKPFSSELIIPDPKATSAVKPPGPTPGPGPGPKSGSLTGKWTFYSGGLVGRADERKEHYRGSLTLSANGGILRLPGDEPLANVVLSGNTIKFTRPGIPQHYEGSLVGANRLEGSFDHKGDKYRWWATK